ncbi:MAG TPA: hypothetical protein VH370_09470 [Humisphaera sp.]|jgi:hypothetical protein|nr:hypothetical protein [Humisphaera sp.]
MTATRKMLLETLVGHMELLESAHPRKAHTALARRARRYVKWSLRHSEAHPKRMALETN